MYLKLLYACVKWVAAFALIAFALPFAVFVGLDLWAGYSPNLADSATQSLEMPYILVGAIGSIFLCPVIYAYKRAVKFLYRAFLQTREGLQPNDQNLYPLAIRHLVLGLVWVNILRWFPSSFVAEAMSCVSTSIDWSFILMILMVVLIPPFNIIGLSHFAIVVRAVSPSHQGFRNRGQIAGSRHLQY